MAIPRPITQTRISTADWGFPITDAVNAHTDQLAINSPQIITNTNAIAVHEGEINALQLTTAHTAWTGFAYATGWVDSASGLFPGWAKVGDRVYLRGLINRTGGNTSGNTTILTLPVGARPAGNEYHLVLNTPNLSVRVDIQNTGIVMVQSSSTVIFASNVSLNGVSFSAV